MTSAAVTESADDNLAEAAAKMRQQQTGSLLITEGSKLSGIITERDVLRVVAEGKDPKATVVRDEMTSDVVTIDPDTSIKDAADLMFSHWFRHLPVVDRDGDVVGIISTRDLLRIVSAGMDEPQNLQALTGHKLARDIRLDRIEAGDLD
ncbi:MAG: CBS domain-containing protein [Actinomycetota bacterium]